MAETVVTIPATRAWLTDPLQAGGPAVVCGTRRPSAASGVVDGELARYAGDRTQLITFGAETYQLPITFEALSVAQLAQVRAWKGRTLLLRTTDGQRLYGGYRQVDEQPYLRLRLTAASVTFDRVTYTDIIP